MEKQPNAIVVEHADIIKDAFWNAHSGLLGDESGDWEACICYGLYIGMSVGGHWLQCKSTSTINVFCMTTVFGKRVACQHAGL